VTRRTLGRGPQNPTLWAGTVYPLVVPETQT